MQLEILNTGVIWHLQLSLDDVSRLRRLQVSWRKGHRAKDVGQDTFSCRPFQKYARIFKGRIRGAAPRATGASHAARPAADRGSAAAHGAAPRLSKYVSELFRGYSSVALRLGQRGTRVDRRIGGFQASKLRLRPDNATKLDGSGHSGFFLCPSPCLLT